MHTLMHSFSRRLSVAALLSASALAVATLSGCVVVPARATYAYSGEAVMVAPPPPQNEVVVAAPGPGYFWIGGYWNWVGGRHMWVGGHWESHRAGYRWAPHEWHREGPGWRMAPGHWERG